MRVSKEKAAENRVALLDAASRLIRERGIDGAGVADIAKAAGLTQGALYAHFASKEALVAEAFSHGVAGNMANARKWAGDRHPSFEEYVEVLLSTSMRDRLATGCPMTASASEIARQGGVVGASFARAFAEMVAMLAGSLEISIPSDDKRRLALAAVAAEIGAVAVSRAIATTDQAEADEVLRAVRDTLEDAHKERRAAAASPRRAAVKQRGAGAKRATSAPHGSRPRSG